MASSNDDFVRTLMDLGFTRLESEIYLYLLEHSPATGYGIAKGIGRFKTNVYETLVSLQTKGAVLVDDGESRLCRAVPPEEFLDQLERRFRESRERATVLAGEMAVKPQDDRIYRLATLDQVYERSRKMLDACKEVTLLELDPGPLDVLRGAVEETAARGVKVSVRIYKPDEIKGVWTILSPFVSHSEKRAVVQWMCINADGRQYLMAQIEPKSRKVHQAVWSASSILAWKCFSLMNTDFTYYSLRPALESTGSLDALRAEFKKVEERFPVGDAPGFRDFQKRFGW